MSRIALIGEFDPAFPPHQATLAACTHSADALREHVTAEWISTEHLTPEALVDYSGIVGLLLAKGHARTSGASIISGYLGKKDAPVEAFARWARSYADQTERDHEELVRAVAAGRLPAEHGI